MDLLSYNASVFFFRNRLTEFLWISPSWFALRGVTRYQNTWVENLQTPSLFTYVNISHLVLGIKVQAMPSLPDLGRRISFSKNRIFFQKLRNRLMGSIFLVRNMLGLPPGLLWNQWPPDSIYLHCYKIHHKCVNKKLTIFYTEIWMRK